MASLAKSLIRLTISTLAIMVLYTIYHQRYWGIVQFTKTDPFDPVGTLPALASQRHSNSLNLNEHECSNVFPRLTKYIQDSIQRGPFKLNRSDDDYQGLVQGRIKDGKLYIVSVARDRAEQERQAVLHQLHRAIITSPEPLPDTHFALCVNDHPKNNSWAFARPNKPSSLNTWLMPHFSFWSWPIKHIGTMDEALERIRLTEKAMPWERKIDKIVWRGTPWFNPIGNKNLRPGLLKVTKGKEWADVQSLQQISPNEQGGISMNIEEFCKYKYIAYTEGVAYSGRLHYHQACASVLITPPLTYLQHTSHLLRPINSPDLFGPMVPPAQIDNSRRPVLPMTRTAHDANAIYVALDWSDLESVILYLRKNPQVAKGIAEQSRAAVMGKNYLSAAAEMCYWRSLIRGWASVVQMDEEAGGEGGWGGGTRFETYAVQGLIRGG